MAQSGLTTSLIAVALAPGAAPPPGAPSSPPPPAPAAACPAPPGWTGVTLTEAIERRFPFPAGNRVANWIGVRAGGALLWNGAPLPRERLDAYLTIVAAMRPETVRVVQRLPGADCGEVRFIIAAVEAAAPCAGGLCLLTAGAPFTPPSAPAPPAPPPPTLAGPATRARADLSIYVIEEDYPAAALRAGEQGSVGFRLDVGADGRVRRCAVTSSSGSSALDAATCRIMTERPLFTPARNPRGEAVEDRVAGRITWSLPEPEPPAEPDASRSQPQRSQGDRKLAPESRRPDGGAADIGSAEPDRRHGTMVP